MALRRGLRALGFVVGGLCVAGSAAGAQDIGCDPGDMEVVRVSFNGNRAFTDAQLGNGLVTTPSSWARRTFRKIGAKRCLDTTPLGFIPKREADAAKAVQQREAPDLAQLGMVAKHARQPVKRNAAAQMVYMSHLGSMVHEATGWDSEVHLSHSQP